MSQSQNQRQQIMPTEPRTLQSRGYPQQVGIVVPGCEPILMPVMEAIYFLDKNKAKAYTETFTEGVTDGTGAPREIGLDELRAWVTLAICHGVPFMRNHCCGCGSEFNLITDTNLFTPTRIDGDSVNGYEPFCTACTERSEREYAELIARLDNLNN